MRNVHILFLALACAPFASTASAQEESEALIEDIVVTAQKREQSLQEVPIAITGIEGSALVGDGADNLADLAGSRRTSASSTCSFPMSRNSRYAESLSAIRTRTPTPRPA